MKENCLIISPAPDQIVLSYQVEMLRYNPQPGIIPLQIRSNNQEISLHYQVGPRQTLADYYRSGGSAESSLAVFKKIVAVLQDSEDLLLYPASFILRADSIYVDGKSGELALIYRPFLPDCSVRDSLLRLCEELLKFIPPSAGARAEIQEINRYLTDSFSNLAGAKKFLDGLGRQGVPAPRSLSSKPFRLAGGMKEETATQREGANSGMPEKKEERAKDIILQGRFKGVFLFALIQLLIALLLLKSAPYLSSLGDPLTTYAGLALFLGGFNLFLLRRLFISGLERVSLGRWSDKIGKKS